LQAVKVDIKLAIDLLLSLDSFINNLRDRFAEFEERAKELSDNENYKTTLQRKRKRNTRFDSDVGNAHTEDVALAGADKFLTETFLVIIDRLTTTLKQRSVAYKMVYHRFAAFLAAVRCSLNLHLPISLPENILQTFPKTFCMGSWFSGAALQCPGNVTHHFCRFRYCMKTSCTALFQTFLWLCVCICH
jgi:hypothetical protein